MSTVEKSIEVAVPIHAAYNQWTQFESFPEFMDGIEQVTQLDDKRLHWKARIGGKEQEWDAEITEQIPDERIAWKSTTGAQNAGVVTFHRIDEATTRVMLQLDTEPHGLVETIGDKLGVAKHTIEKDLERFKTFIEERGSETGAWRGEVERPGS